MKFREHFKEYWEMYLVAGLMAASIGVLTVIMVKPIIQRELHPIWESYTMEVVNPCSGVGLWGEEMKVLYKDGGIHVWSKGKEAKDAKLGDVYYVVERNGKTDSVERIGNVNKNIIFTTRIVKIENDVAFIEYDNNIYGYYFTGADLAEEVTVVFNNENMEIIDAR